MSLPNEDNLLIQRARNGDADAASLLFARNREWLRNYIRPRVRNDEHAEDLVQEALLRAYGSLANFRGDSKFSTWLLRIALNLVANYHTRTLPKESRDISLDAVVNMDALPVKRFDTDPGLNDLVANAIYNERLFEALRRTCTSIETQVYWLVLQEQSYEEISALLRITQAAARQHYKRGREKLFAYLMEYDREMLGGTREIENAWRQACSSPDKNDQPTPEEQEAWCHPAGRAKAFRRAVLKMVRYLPLLLMMWLAVRCWTG